MMVRAVRTAYDNVIRTIWQKPPFVSPWCSVAWGMLICTIHDAFTPGKIARCIQIAVAAAVVVVAWCRIRILDFRF